jgi:hypothetical protein
LQLGLEGLLDLDHRPHRGRRRCLGPDPPSASEAPPFVRGQFEQFLTADGISLIRGPQVRSPDTSQVRLGVAPEPAGRNHSGAFLLPPQSR